MDELNLDVEKLKMHARSEDPEECLYDVTIKADSQSGPEGITRGVGSLQG